MARIFHGVENVYGATGERRGSSGGVAGAPGGTGEGQDDGAYFADN